MTAAPPATHEGVEKGLLNLYDWCREPHHAAINHAMLTVSCLLRGRNDRVPRPADRRVILPRPTTPEEQVWFEKAVRLVYAAEHTPVYPSPSGNVLTVVPAPDDENK